MSKPATAIVTTVTALAVAWFWFRPSEPGTPASSETHITEPDVAVPETTSSVASVTAFEDNTTP
jgi:hypothetical protein